MINQLSSYASRGERLQVIVNEVFVACDRHPVEVIHVHFLAGAVINSSKHVDLIVEVGGTMQEPCIGHLLEFYELVRFQVQDH